MTDKGLLLTDNGPLLTDNGPLLTDNGLLLTEKGLLLTDNGPWLTDNGFFLGKSSLFLRVLAAKIWRFSWTRWITTVSAGFRSTDEERGRPAFRTVNDNVGISGQAGMTVGKGGL
ncbi:MAG TPA: hypothetical protein VJL58_09395, partial [Pyrinomonadaceae bacterium]|nr:hypothetical protein [Pyrinomonadaceae bacterium]